MRRTVRSMMWALVFGVAATSAFAGGPRSRSSGTLSREYVEARAFFEKIWTPQESRGATGDGLGPLFNDRSCVGCHNQGGVGGAGDSSHDVQILTAVPGASPSQCPTNETLFRGELETLHPGLRNGGSVVVHQNANAEKDQSRLNSMRSYRAAQTRDELFEIKHSSRNTPALFGAGQIDHISDKALRDVAARPHTDFPEIKGRVSRLKNGQLGKFGWKGQTASLRDFVLAACSNELGLEVPGRHQVSLASAKDFDPSTLKLDMDIAETQKLTSFVQTLPAPVFRAIDPVTPMRGRVVFDSIGCAACHMPKLSQVDGIYSDLLLHDLGDRIQDFGLGYGMASKPIGVTDRSDPRAESTPSTGEAGPTEWRTTPLWGVASSAPYLHDGRAKTFTEAIRLHGGEAAQTTDRFTRLGFDDQQALLAFLHSLVAPPNMQRLVDAGRRQK